MVFENGTAILTKLRSVDDYTLDMRVGKMSGPQAVKFLRVASQLQNVGDMSDSGAMADAIDMVLSIARKRFKRKDGQPITDEESEWCLDNIEFDDLMATFSASNTEAVVPPTNTGN